MKSTGHVVFVRNTIVDVQHVELHLVYASTSSSSDSGSSTQRLDSLGAMDDRDIDQGLDAAMPSETALPEPAQPVLPVEPPPMGCLVPSQVAEESTHDRDRHEARKCIPCVALIVTKDCTLGAQCRFCHFSHEENLKQ